MKFFFRAASFSLGWLFGWWRLIAFAAFGAALGAVAAENPAARVLILANSADPDSLRIARHYAEARAVPTENIIALKMSVSETISWREFVATLWQPLRDDLVSRHWIDAVGSTVTDDIGRKKYVVNGHRISALVVCRGVPLRIMHEPEFYRDNLPLTLRTELRSNAGAVDSELCLLAHSNYNINAMVSNPFFQKETVHDLDRAQVIPVGRLDGPTPEDAMALVDRALAVEKTGLIGRAYVDIGGKYPAGDRWFEAVAAQLAVLGYDTSVDVAPSTIPMTARCDEPALYFGWYAGDLNGPFALPGFRFVPGAVALHLHSYSAVSMRSATSGWSAPLVARGVGATVGNVHEPYLSFTHRPEFLLHALARGATLGEAALYALPGLSWQAILIGDPLYRPFAISFEEQWKNRASLSPRQVNYVVLRRAHLLENAGKREEALALLRATQQANPNLPVGLMLAQRLQKEGDAAEAVRTLEFAATLKNFRPDEWGLVHEVAQFLTSHAAGKTATELYRALFASEAFPRDLRMVWLQAAVQAALAAGNPTQSAAWEKEREELGGGPVPKK